MRRYLLIPFFVILLFTPIHIFAQDFESSLTITEARILADIIGEDAEIPILSPDGLKIAFINPEMQLCVLEIDNENSSCTTLPISFIEPFDRPLYETPHRLVWSPDSERIALNEAMVDSSNIWIYNTTAKTFTRITATVVIDAMLDDFARWHYAPVWTHDGDALYYFDSYLNHEENMTFAMYQYDFVRDESVLLYDFADSIRNEAIQFPLLTSRFSSALSGTVVLSPDGTQLAFVSYEVTSADRNNYEHNIWLIDVSAETPPEQLVTSKYLGTTLPHQDIQQFRPAGLAWISDGSGIVTNATSTGYYFFGFPYHIDLASGDVTPLLIDGENFTEEAAANQSAQYRRYQGSHVLLVNDELVIFNRQTTFSFYTIHAIPQDVIEVRPASYPSPDWAETEGLAGYPSVSTDGSRAIIYDWLITIEQ